MCRLITLPVRVAASATRLVIHVTARSAGAVLHTAENLVSGSPPPSPEPVTRPTHGVSARSLAIVVAAPGAEPVPTPEPAPIAEASEGTPDSAPTGSETPAHASAEPRLVATFAEPGAEEGAGASVHAREPWPGYRNLTAGQIIARLEDASREELAEVSLYEGLHRRRRTVIERADRQLRRATADARRA